MSYFSNSSNRLLALSSARVFLKRKYQLQKSTSGQASSASAAAQLSLRLGSMVGRCRHTASPAEERLLGGPTAILTFPPTQAATTLNFGLQWLLRNHYATNPDTFHTVILATAVALVAEQHLSVFIRQNSQRSEHSLQHLHLAFHLNKNFALLNPNNDTLICPVHSAASSYEGQGKQQ